MSGGGRYDELVSMFAQKDVKVCRNCSGCVCPPIPAGMCYIPSHLFVQIPCVGFSIGIERLFSIMEARAKVRLSAPYTSAMHYNCTIVDSIYYTCYSCHIHYIANYVQ